MSKVKMNERETVIMKILSDYESPMCAKAIRIIGDESRVYGAFEDAMMKALDDFNGNGDMLGFTVQRCKWGIGNLLDRFYSKKETEERANACCELTEDIVECVGVMDKEIENIGFDDYYNQFKSTLNDTQKDLLSYLYEDEYAISQWCEERKVSKAYGSKIRKQLREKFMIFNAW